MADDFVVRAKGTARAVWDVYGRAFERLNYARDAGFVMYHKRVRTIRVYVPPHPDFEGGER